tara:strand:+ start:512 stop:766 length:255 start_codon:yes stop_codon:yes gene_type:complete
MKTNFKMKEAINPNEARLSILDVLKENPLWMNKVTDSLSIILRGLSDEEREYLLNKTIDEQVVDLFVNIKKEYYHFKDFTQWNY